MAEKELPELYSGWKTVRKIGSGSFGVVYEIHRELFGHVEKAALKLISIPQNEDDVDELRSNGYDNTSITAHFKGCLSEVVREYSLMADMKGHVNIVYCDDIRIIQQDNGFGWDILIKMELLTPLLHTLKPECSEEQIIKIGRDICGALIFCKKKNIIHRDIKPQNIFVSENGDYKLGDFGIAKTVEKTMGGTKIGTYNYMAPEVYNNQPYGSAADIYSLGLVLYWLLNERRMPFLPLPPRAPSFAEHEQSRQRRLAGEPIPAPKHGSEELKRIVLKACAYKPKDRYADAGEMRESLSHLIDGASSHSVAARTSQTTGFGATTTELSSEDTIVRDENYQKRNTSSSQVSQASPPKNETSHTVLLPAEELPPRSVSRGKRKRGLPLIAACLSGVILLALALLYIGIQQNQAKKQAQLQEAYIAAEKLYESGEYDEAIAAFEALNDYQDSADIILEVQYAKARKILKEGNYDEALAVFSALGDYADSSEQAKSAQLMVDYRAAEALLKEGKYEQAIVAFTALGDYQDSVQQVQKAQQALNYEAAAALLKEGAYEEAITAFEALGNYRDSVKQMENARLAADYAAAEKLFQAGNYDQAIAVYESLNGYKDSADQIPKVQYAKASKMLADGYYDEAIAAFEALGDYLDSSEQMRIAGSYASADSLVKSGKTAEAAMTFYALDKKERSFALWSTLTVQETISAGFDNTVGLKDDGTVVGNFSQCDINGWSDIVAISAGGFHTVGLKSDGTVVAVGSVGSDQCSVDSWKDIVAVSAGCYHTVGLKADGTVVAVGSNKSRQCNVDGWKDIVAVSAGYYHTVGLKADGTVVAVGSNISGRCNVDGWKDIVAVSAGGFHTVGLKSDGAVVAVGKNSNGQCDVTKWQDIKLPEV